jgi:hypothetical protein
LSMCNLSRNFAQNRPSGNDHHALEDFQLQQMISGQHGLIMARQGRRILGEASSSTHTPTIHGSQSRAKPPILMRMCRSSPSGTPHSARNTSI